ncbi:DNA-directed RNA polymerase subunit L [Candidatus Woesearchaeota archaeon]|nr:DNA-directed RNA polymerase subunit L [Candidatus Woesearchaeota archaeon]
MEVIIVNNEKDLLQVKVSGEGHTFCNFLSHELWSNSDVAYASYCLGHPIIEEAILALKVKKGEPKKVIKDTIDSLKKKNNDFRTSFNKL